LVTVSSASINMGMQLSLFKKNWCEMQNFVVQTHSSNTLLPMGIIKINNS
jgi:hypothetical protein